MDLPSLRSSTASADERAPLDQEWRADLARKLDTLPEAQAAALRLVYSDGLRQSEAAALMGLTPPAFSTVIAQGLHRLGQMLVYQGLAAQIMECCQPSSQAIPLRSAESARHVIG